MRKSIVVMIVLALLPVCAFATEHLIPLQGIAKDSYGTPLASGDIAVRIYDAETGGSVVYNSGADFNEAIEDGIYDVVLGSITPLDLDNTVKYYIEIDVNGEEVVGDATSGRQAFWPGSGDHTHSH